MSKALNDISLIKRYLAGELDSRAMHELERRALDDPFLADALEGYEHSEKDQQKNLDDLSARLHNRTDKKVRVLTPGMQLSVAASLLVIIGIGAWLVIRNQNAKQQQLKQVVVNVPSAPKPEQPAVSTPSPLSPKVVDTPVKRKAGIVNKFKAPVLVSNDANEATNQPPAVAELQVEKDSIRANHIAANNNVAPGSGYLNTSPATKNDVGTADYKSNTSVANDAIVQSLNANKATTKKYRAMVPETLLTAHDNNVAVQPALNGNHTTLIGYVTGNNQPVVGAVVKVAGADFGVVTDVNGKFVMHNVPEDKSLEVKSLGYDTKQVKLNGRDSITVSLQPNVNALANVTILKSAPNSNDDKSSGSVGVHPSAGWKALNNYLDKNAVSPDGNAGKVVLSFTVNGRGGLSGFTVVQSLSAAADQKAIDLISNGPGWAGNIDDQPHEVKVTVSFH